MHTVVVGSFYVDHLWRCDALPTSGERIDGSYTSRPGGKGFNQAIATAHAGVTTFLLCALGHDSGGALAHQLAKDRNISLIAEASPEPTGAGGVYTDAHGHRATVISPGANATFSSQFITAKRDCFASAAVVLAQLESPSNTVETAFKLARQAGAMTILNPAPANAQCPSALLQLTRVLTPNASEFAALLNRHVGVRMRADDVAATDNNSLHTLCRKLLPTGTVVITLDSVGAFISHADPALLQDTQAHYRIAGAPILASETAQVGDAFNGSLAAAIAADPQTCFADHTRFAIRQAGLVAQQTKTLMAAQSVAWPNQETVSL